MQLSNRALNFIKTAKANNDNIFVVCYGYKTTGSHRSYGGGNLRTALALEKLGLATQTESKKYRERCGCGTEHWTEVVFTLTDAGKAYVNNL